MITLKVKKEISVQECLDQDKLMSITSDITPSVLKDLVERSSPYKYNEFISKGVLKKFKSSHGVIDDRILKILTLGNEGVDISYLISDCNLSATAIQYLVQKNFHSDALVAMAILKQPNTPSDIVLDLFDSTFKTNNFSILEYESLIFRLANNNQFDVIKQLYAKIKEFDSVHEDITYFESIVFVATATHFLTKEDCVEMFGHERPDVSPMMIRERSPCREGYIRLRKHAELDAAPVPWNVLMARHFASNINALDAAKRDWIWYAEIMLGN